MDARRGLILKVMGGAVLCALIVAMALPTLYSSAATVLLDPLALTVFDAAHSQHEERWFTLGTSSEGQLLAVSHTYPQPEGAESAEVRIISAREATRRERQQYEEEPR